jgi:hypothetical protein
MLTEDLIESLRYLTDEILTSAPTRALRVECSFVDRHPHMAFKRLTVETLPVQNHRDAHIAVARNVWFVGRPGRNFCVPITG